jgi:outer membrane protein assembly factor BamB
VSFEKAPKSTRAAAGAVALLVLAALVMVVAGCGSSSSSSSSSGGGEELTGSGEPGINAANTREVGGPIDSSSVSGLEVAWTLPITGEGAYGSYASTPIISNGVAYSQDLASNVQAVDLETGEVLWTKKYELASHGPNGLVVAGGHVYGATPSEAFALDQKTGKQVWATKLTRNEHEGIDMAPGYHEGMVYVATVPATASEDYHGGTFGVLWALDGKTGKKLWHFDTVPDLMKGPNTDINAGGGLWYPPSFDKKGFMYFGVGNPAPLPGEGKFPFGSSRPGPNLYADSLVKLDAKTGKMQWYYQETPHNIYDWDFQDSPILTSSGGKELAIGAGKSGVVVAVDANTGKVVWKQPVGKHNGHDNDSLYAMRGEYSKIKAGEIFPGELGGVIAPMAANDSTVFVPVVNHSMTLVSGTEVTESSTATGELVALDIATGKVKWKINLPAPAYGAPIVVNDLVFATTSEGTIYAVDAETGGEVWVNNLPAGTNAGVMVNGDTLLAPAGLPIEEGQKAELVAYRLGG